MTSKTKKIRNLLNEIVNGFENREMINNGKVEQSGLYAIWFPEAGGKYEIETYATYNDGNYVHIYKGKINVNTGEYIILNERTTKTTSTMIENSLLKYYSGPNPKGSHDASGHVLNIFALKDDSHELPKKVIVNFIEKVNEVGKIDVRGLDEDQIYDKLEEWIDNNVYDGEGGEDE